MYPHWEADEFIKVCPEVQSLAVCVKGWAAEPQVVIRFFLIVAQAARGFLRLVDQSLPASECGMVADTEAAKVGRFRRGREDIFLLKWISGLGGGVKRRGVGG